LICTKPEKLFLHSNFYQKKRIGTGQYERRDLHEFFKVWDDKYEITDCVCTYAGKTYALRDGKRSSLTLKDNKMPFSKK